MSQTPRTDAAAKSWSTISNDDLRGSWVPVELARELEVALSEESARGASLVEQLNYEVGLSALRRDDAIQFKAGRDEARTYAENLQADLARILDLTFGKPTFASDREVLNAIAAIADDARVKTSANIGPAIGQLDDVGSRVRVLMTGHLKGCGDPSCDYMIAWDDVLGIIESVRKSIPSQGNPKKYPPRGPGTCACADPENCTEPVRGCRACHAEGIPK